MVDAGTQVDSSFCTDQFSIASCETLNDLRDEFTNLTELAGTKHRKIIDFRGTLESMERELVEFISNQRKLNDEVKRNDKELETTKGRSRFVQDEINKLLESNKKLLARKSLNELTRKVTQSVLCLQQDDVRHVIEMRGCAKDEYYKRIQQLNELREKLADCNERIKNEWTHIQKDVDVNREKAREYRRSDEELNNLKLSILRKRLENTNIPEEERACIEGTIEYLQLRSECKAMDEELFNKTILAKQGEIKIAELIAEKRKTLKQVDYLSQSIRKLHMRANPREQACLRETTPYTNLTEISSALPANFSAPGEEETSESLPFGGQLLHRCSKVTNLSFENLQTAHSLRRVVSNFISPLAKEGVVQDEDLDESNGEESGKSMSLSDYGADVDFLEDDVVDDTLDEDLSSVQVYSARYKPRESESSAPKPEASENIKQVQKNIRTEGNGATGQMSMLKAIRGRLLGKSSSSHAARSHMSRLSTAGGISSTRV